MTSSIVLFTVATVIFLYPYCSSSESSSELVMDCINAEDHYPFTEQCGESDCDCQFRCYREFISTNSVGNCSEGYCNSTSYCDCVKKFARAHNCSEDKCFVFSLNELVFQPKDSECNKKLVKWVLHPFSVKCPECNLGVLLIGINHDAYQMEDQTSVNSIIIRFNVSVTKSANYTLALSYKVHGDKGKWKDVSVYFKATDRNSTDPCLSTLLSRRLKHGLPPIGCLVVLFQPFCLPEGMNLTLYITIPKLLSPTDELIIDSVFLLPHAQYTSDTKRLCLSECHGFGAIKCLCLRNTTGTIYVILCNGTHCCPCLSGWTCKLCNDCSNGDNNSVPLESNLSLCPPHIKWHGVAGMCMPVNRTCISCQNSWAQCGYRDGCYESLPLSCLPPSETVKEKTTHTTNYTNTEGSGSASASGSGSGSDSDSGEELVLDLREGSVSTNSRNRPTAFHFVPLPSKLILLQSAGSPTSIQWPLTRTSVFLPSEQMSVTKTLASSNVIYWQVFDKSRSSTSFAVPVPSHVLTSHTQEVSISVSVSRSNGKPVVSSIPVTTASSFSKSGKHRPAMVIRQWHTPFLTSNKSQPSNVMTPVPAAHKNSSDSEKRILIGVIVATLLIGILFMISSVLLICFCLHKRSEQQNEEIGLTKQLRSHLLDDEGEPGIQMDFE